MMTNFHNSGQKFHIKSTKRTLRHGSRKKISNLVRYGFASVFLVFLFPSTVETNLWLRSERVQFWLPITCAALGLLAYLLKINFLLAFGAAELALC